MPKVFKLDFGPLPTAEVIAISSHVNDYRLCWALNQSLGLDLAKRDTDLIDQGPERMASYTVFDHHEEDTNTTVSLVANHDAEGVLIPDQRQADYFLVIDPESNLRPVDLLERIRRTEFVLAAFPLEFSTIKGAYKLLE